ncbi:hypothetical protein Xenpb_03087 [Xenorhabdus sp. PB62.4]|nr:hypothetical protein [Xenorhabdus sp. PB62.4]
MVINLQLIFLEHLIGIPQTYLAGNDSFDNFHHGEIYFYYTVNIDSDNIVSQTWKGQIDTVPPSTYLDCE